MATDNLLTAEIIAHAESFSEVKAGMVSLADVLKGGSYQAGPEGERPTTELDDLSVPDWPAGARSVLVLGLRHPETAPELDWWKGGNTLGNRRLMEISERITHWLRKNTVWEPYNCPIMWKRANFFLKMPPS